MGRIFQGLRTEPPQSRYDAVIIGAGIGGMVLANLLAREGMSVLMVEQHYMVGGYCSTFKRNGYVFDAATHFYPLLGNRSTLTGALLEELGIETGWVKMDPVDTFHFPDGSRFEVPADFATYRKRLDEEFPEEREAMDRFFKLAEDVYMLGLLRYFRGRPCPPLEQYRHLTVREVIDREFKSPKLKLLLTADSPHWGSPPNQTSFVFDSMLRLSYFLGNYYPVGGSQAFADELARSFEDLGGHILMSTHAHRIRVENGRACGVELETLRGKLKGRYDVEAGVMISNSDLLQTCENLLGPELVDDAYLEQVRGMRPSHPCFLTHIGLRDVPDEVLDEAQGYYWNTWNSDLLGQNGLRCKIFAPTLYEPDLAPEGGQIVILQKVLDMDYFLPEGLKSLDQKGWARHKQRVEDFVVAHFERVVPGVSEKIVVKLSASARTSWRFTLNLSGAMLGWEMSPEQLGDNRPGIEGPVDNLYLVGHWTQPGGGITPVIVSALQVAEALTSYRRAKTGVARPALV